MTEETMQDQNTEQQNEGVNISVEQILAAIINTVGDVTVQLETLIQNYGTKSISVNQNEDKSVTFSLVDNPVTEEISKESKLEMNRGPHGTMTENAPETTEAE